MSEAGRELTDLAHEAEDISDMFISYAILNKNIKGSNKRLRHDTSVSHGASVNRHTYSALEAPSCFSPGISNGMLDYPLNLKDVMDRIKSIGKEMSNMKCMVNNKTIQQFVKKDMMNKKLDNQCTSPQATRSSCSINTATVKHSAAKHEEIIVGFDDDALSIIDRLTGDRKQLDIISIVGMGGLGKTTLATKIYNDQYAVYYFDIRGWISVSQAYSKRDLLIQILVSIGKTVHDTTSEPKVCEMLYKSLKGRKYLIVIDDIWSAAAWDDLRLCFPDDKTGSRVLLTTRLAEVACHANRGGFTHNLQLLSEEKSWELLCRKTFRGDDCPEKLIETGKHIRSVLCFHYYGAHTLPLLPDYRMQWKLFLLLRVLDLLNVPIKSYNLGKRLRKLVHLKYLAVYLLSKNDYPFSDAYCEFSISKAYIWSLQTLILGGEFQIFKFSQENMADIVNLRHLRCDNINISIYFGVPLLKLQTISTLRLDCTTIMWQHSFPNIKKLGCSVSSISSDWAFLNFAMFTHLQALNLQNDMDTPLPAKNPITLPETLKSLTLKGCRLPWIYMSTIQRLPKLEVLKLLDSSFEGDMWDAGDDNFTT